MSITRHLHWPTSVVHRHLPVCPKLVIFWTSPKLLNSIYFTGSKYSMSSFKFFVFFWPIRNQRWPPWLLIGWDIFNFSFESLNGIRQNLTPSSNLTSYTKLVFFWADRKTKIAALAYDWPSHFRLLLCNCWIKFEETLEKASTRHPLPSLCLLGWSIVEDGLPCLWLA